jgi:hypothetical protein
MSGCDEWPPQLSVIRLHCDMVAILPTSSLTIGNPHLSGKPREKFSWCRWTLTYVILSYRQKENDTQEAAQIYGSTQVAVLRGFAAVKSHSGASNMDMNPFTPITGPLSEKDTSRTVVDTSVERVTGLDFRHTEEFLAVEEPLEI